MALMSDLISQGDVGVTFSRCLFLLSSEQDVVQFLFIVSLTLSSYGTSSWFLSDESQPECQLARKPHCCLKTLGGVLHVSSPNTPCPPTSDVSGAPAPKSPLLPHRSRLGSERTVRNKYSKA